MKLTWLRVCSQVLIVSFTLELVSIIYVSDLEPTLSMKWQNVLTWSFAPSKINILVLFPIRSVSNLSLRPVHY